MADDVLDNASEDRTVERVICGRFAADDDERLCWLGLVRHGGGRMGLDPSLITLAPVIARLPREFKQAGAAAAQFGLPAQPVHDGFRRHACRREDAR